MKLSVEVKGVERWSCGDLVLAAGRHDLGSDLAHVKAGIVTALAAAAAAAGSGVEILEADAAAKSLIAGAVESDKDSLKRAPKLAAGADDASVEAWSAFEVHQAAELARIKAEIAKAN